MRTPITYYGGKQRMAKKIVSILPEHRTYVEPYFGGGAVFFQKKRSKVEVINDINDRLIDFYLAIQNDHEALFKLIKNTPHSEALHKLAREIYNKRTDYDKLGMAWAVWYMTNGSFTGSPHGSWRWCNGKAGSDVGRVLSNKRNQLSEALYNRLKDAQISSRDAIRVIKDRDSDKTLYYLDPPYPGANQKHYAGFTFTDYRELLDLLITIKGKFILSNYWSQTLKYYILKNGWYHSSVESYVVVNRIREPHNTLKKTEWLITNFKLPEINEQKKLL